MLLAPGAPLGELRHAYCAVVLGFDFYDKGWAGGSPF